jgi:hypothetical protein
MGSVGAECINVATIMPTCRAIDHWVEHKCTTIQAVVERLTRIDRTAAMSPVRTPTGGYTRSNRMSTQSPPLVAQGRLRASRERHQVY